MNRFFFLIFGKAYEADIPEKINYRDKIDCLSVLYTHGELY